MRKIWWIPILAVFVGGGLWLAFSTETGEKTRPGPDRQTVQATLYFVNTDYVNSGNEALAKVKPIRRALNLSRMPLAEAVVRALFIKPDSAGLSTALEGLTLLNVRTEGDTAFVNFSSAGLGGGSLTERLVIEQVVRSLTESGNVRSVQFLADGKKRESLMGHIDTRTPISPDDL